MKSVKMLAFVSILISRIFAQQAFSPQEIYEKSQNCIVFIVTYDKTGALQSYGSGVIVSEDWLVYTNHHVINGYNRIELRNGAKVYNEISVVGFNPLFDAAILKIASNDIFSNYIKTNDSMPNVGEVIYALGNPQGYTKTLSTGLISGLRESEGVSQIQYNASISPGSSGGALLNIFGELIGITCSTNTTGQNLNFAIPVSYFRNISLVNYNDSSNVNNLSLLFNIYNNKATYDNYRTFDAVQKYLEQTSPSVNNYILISEIYKKFSRNDSAVIYLSKALELEPQNKLLYKLRGDALSMVSESDSAIGDYNIAISIDTNFIPAYLGRALLYEISLNDYDRAASDYSRIIGIDPDYSYLYTYRSNCFLSLGDTSRALEDLNKTFSFDQKFDYNYSKRAELYTNLKMYDEAIWDYTEAIRLNPTNPDYYFRRAILYSKTGQNLLAIDDYRAYNKFGEGDMAYNNMAYGYLAEGDYEDAERYFNKSLLENNRHLDSYLGLSILNYRQGKIKKMQLNMCKAMDINSLLEFGMPGIAEMEKQGWFWDENEKSDFKKIFKLMGIKSRKVDNHNRNNNKVKADNAN